MEQPKPTVLSPGAQVQRAWLVVRVAFAIFLGITVLGIAGSVWVYRHATESEVAKLQVVSGRGALVRSPQDSEWRFVTGGTRIREGDRVSTALGTVVRLTMFDDSTVEITEDTDVRVVMMRTSRFLKRTKLVVLEPLRGTIYVSMSPRERYGYSETIVQRGATRVSMVDGEHQPEAGSFLVEVRDRSGVEASLRIAVLTGTATVTTATESRRLSDTQQVGITANGSVSDVEDAVRELIINGNFSDGMSGWVEFQRDEDGADSGAPPGASVELVPDQTSTGTATSVEFLRASGDDRQVETGIRQRIGTTLRVYSSLVLDFEVKINDQSPLLQTEGGTAYPLVVEINYLDLDGAERRWSHGYYVLNGDRGSRNSEIATLIDRGVWQRVVFDLRNMDPIPRQITSIVVYASGQQYATQVANLSLSSSEAIDPAD